jgi:predicted flavoprotein YhiN
MNNNPGDSEGRVIVIGAGASGMMAAGKAAEMGASVLLLEKTERTGKKLLISGKSRCNLTNAKDFEHFLAMYGANGRFLRQAFNRYFREDLLSFFLKYGLETKTERGGRIFPLSDDARDVVAALMQYLSESGVTIQYRQTVRGIITGEQRVTGVQTDKGTIPAAAVIIATGGASYPGTGSSGDGYKMAAALGHAVIKQRPALVPLVVDNRNLAKSMQGVSLRNIRLTAFQCPAEGIDDSLTPCEDTGRGIAKKPVPPVIESRMGEMMMTHFGIGGPITLLMSLSIVDALDRGPVSVSIDLKPALDREQLRLRLQRDFDRFSKRSYRRILTALLPGKLVDPFVAMTAVPPDKQAHQITAEERERLLNSLKSLRFNILRSLPLASAIVTAGGVSLKEVNPRTMASRLISGLYLCGEVLDIDADTGGYNLQAAFSTGCLAGEEAAAFVKEQGTVHLRR